MASDRIESKRGSIGRGIDYLTVGHKSRFYKSLEAVADSEHQTVTVFQKVVHAVAYLCVSENGCNEFA